MTKQDNKTETPVPTTPNKPNPPLNALPKSKIKPEANSAKPKKSRRWLNGYFVVLLAVMVASAGWYGLKAPNAWVNDLLSPSTDERASLMAEISVIKQQFQADLAQQAQAQQDQKAQLSRVQNELSRLRAKVSTIDNRQLQPKALLSLVDNHLSMVQQQLWFEYSKAHIEQQLQSVYDLLIGMQSTDVTSIAADIDDIKTQFILEDHPAPISEWIDQLAAFEQVASEAGSLKAAIDSNLIKANDFSSYVKQRLNQLISIEKSSSAKQSLVIFNKDLKQKWLKAHLEILKLRILAHDWQAMNLQAKLVKQWLAQHSPDLLASISPLLAELQTHQPKIGQTVERINQARQLIDALQH